MICLYLARVPTSFSNGWEVSSVVFCSSATLGRLSYKIIASSKSVVAVWRKSHILRGTRNAKRNDQNPNQHEKTYCPCLLGGTPYRYVL